MRVCPKQIIILQTCCFLLLALVLLFSPFAVGDGLIRFDISQQRADKAIIEFAKKSNQTIVFSFDLTRKHQANDLKGYYSATSG